MFETIRRLPPSPGAYLFKNRRGQVVYVGKAANLKERVRSYFGAISSHSVIPAHAGIQRLRGSRIKSGMTAEDRGQSFGRPIEDMIGEVARVGVRRTPTVIEALVLEAALIKKHWPRYNVRDKDQKSFLYVVVTREKYPLVELTRGGKLERSSSVILSKRARPRSFDFAQDDSGRVRAPKDLPFAAIFGPFPHASAIRAALRIIRKIFPYSTCKPPSLMSSRAHSTRSHARSGQAPSRDPSTPLRSGRDDKIVRPCFNYHIGLCPGVCIGAITPQEYKKTIRNIILFFEGKKTQIIRELKRDMVRASRDELFESAAKIRNQIRALERIRDVAVITREPPTPTLSLKPGRGDRYAPSPLRGRVGVSDASEAINIFGRIEGYDISNIGGKYAVGSMVVFAQGEPKKSEYRLFKIKTVKGANDAAMMKEVLRRRLKHSIMSSRPTPPFANGGGVERSPLGAAKGRSLDMARDDKKKWPLPQLILVDGGMPQVNAARGVLRQFSPPASCAPSNDWGGEVRRGGRIPIIGIAKGPDRKRDEFIITGDLAVKEELERITRLYPHILKHLRDEAHRFAQNYYRRRHRRAVAHR